MSATSTPLLRLTEFLKHESRRAKAEVTLFVDSPPSQWPRTLSPSYSTLLYLLEAAHDDLDRDASRSLALTEYVLRHARHAWLPHQDRRFLRALLIGRAWKEHGNALCVAGKLRGAVIAARRAERALSHHELLVAERTSARFLQAKLKHQQGDDDSVRALLAECRQVFETLGDAQRAMHVANMEAVILVRAGAYEEAWNILQGAQSTAKRLHDERELGRICNNLGQCAIHLGRVKDSIVFLRTARSLFEKHDMLAERSRIFWGYARLLIQLGELDCAVEQLRKIRQEFLERGMVVEAAEAGLDLVDLLDTAGQREEVVHLAQELTAVFSNAGMNRQLRRALAYLLAHARDQRASVTCATAHVRSFLRALSANPLVAFEALEKQRVLE
jgi:tetratricopeptide (TPR) repeat protein